MSDIRNKTVYHFFHASLAHHNRYFVPLFVESNEWSEFDSKLILLNPHKKADINASYHYNLQSLIQFILFLLRKIKREDTIIIHGLYSNWYYLIPIFSPWLAKNIVWDIWGDDFYSVDRLIASTSTADKLRYKVRQYSVPKFAALAGFNGDINAVEEHFRYKNKRFYINHPLRPAIDNLVIEETDKPNEGSLKILIGNSGSRSNEHIRAIELLKKSPMFDELQLFCIFSTDTDPNYTLEFNSYIETNNITNLTVITELLLFDDFIEFIKSLDCLVLPHKRQQGVGTANLGLILGKPVYMDSQIATAKYYSDKGINTLDIESLPQIKATELNKVDGIDNANKVRALFGRSAVKEQWYKLIKEFNYSG